MSKRKLVNHLINKLYRRGFVAMFHTGRCGSTVLARMLDQHSQIFWPGEIFEDKKMPIGSKTPKDFEEGVIRSSSDLKISKFYGFETKYLHFQHICPDCVNMNIDKYIHFLEGLNFRYFIVLSRKNYLRQLLSERVGSQTRTWHSTEEARMPTKIKLDINQPRTAVEDSLFESFLLLDDQRSLLLESLSGKNYLELYYEDDIEKDPLVAYAKVCSYLNLSTETPKVTLKKTNPFLVNDICENYEEIRRELTGTRFQWMLDS